MSRFANLDDLTRDEQLAANTKKFVASGTPFIEVPGCVAVEAIRLGAQPMELQETRVYPKTGAPNDRGEEVVEPLVRLERKSDGTPVLIRSELSNNGVWQKGVSVFVTGEWDDVPGSAAKPAPAARANGGNSRKPKPAEGDGTGS